MNSLSERLQFAMNQANLNQEQLAKKANTTQVTISNILRGKTSSPRNLVDIASALGYRAEWLQIGEGSPAQIKAESNVGDRGGFELWNSQTPLSDDDYEVPFLKDIELAAGDGTFDQIDDYNGFKLRFSKATLRRQGVQYENAVCVTATGESMEPVIPDGTTIGIDLGNKTIRDGKIYAINHGGLLRVKILSRLPNDQVVIRSYNSEEYPDEVVHMSELNVIGKVFWWSVLV